MNETWARGGGAEEGAKALPLPFTPPLGVVKGHGAGRKGAGVSLSLFSAERQEKVKISGN